MTGCSTDHLGEVYERTVREEENESGVRIGKQKEWDGRGSGVYDWETGGEEDIWEADLDFGGLDPDECSGGMEVSESRTRKRPGTLDPHLSNESFYTLHHRGMPPFEKAIIIQQ